MLRAMNRGMVAQEPSQVSFLSTAKSLAGCWYASQYIALRTLAQPAYLHCMQVTACRHSMLHESTTRE